MDQFDYRTFYDRVGAENGWDFSKVKCQIEGRGIDLYAELIKQTKGSELLLDIGTGGGEALLSISKSVLLAVGIDNSSGMISTANRNFAKANTANARFLVMDGARLHFPDSFFDLVTCRHSDFSPEEVFRVLTRDGVFMTQQVSENDKSNIKECFGRGQSFGIKQGTLKGRYMDALSDAGFENIQSLESNVTEYYSHAEDLIFLLEHTPIVPDFGECQGDLEILDRFIQTHTTRRGIATNGSRFMIVARK